MYNINIIYIIYESYVRSYVRNHTISLTPHAARRATARHAHIKRQKTQAVGAHPIDDRHPAPDAARGEHMTRRKQ